MHVQDHKLIFGVALSVILGSTLLSNPANAAEGAASSSATIVAPITISEDQGLLFGNLAPTGTAGTATIDTADGLVVSNVDVLSGVTPKSGAFTVGGGTTATYSITLPSTVTMSDGAGGSMTLDNFGHSAGATPQMSGGADTFKVGAQLSVGASQAAGAYTGSYTVTVSYN